MDGKVNQRAVRGKREPRITHAIEYDRMNMIVGFSEMILQAPETYGSEIPRALLADLTVIHRNSEHLTDLIDDVLDPSQIEMEQMALTKQADHWRELHTYG